MTLPHLGVGGMKTSALDKYHGIKITNKKKNFSIILFIYAILFNISGANAQQVNNNNYKTDAWGGQFKYGAYSTLIASHILAVEFPQLLARLGKFSIQYTDNE